MEKFANALSEAFMEKYPKVTVTAEFVGSGAGIEAVSNGTADIGNSSRNLKDEEKAKGVAENIVAIDGIAVVVDPANTVEDLTKDQLTSIYDGSVTNWKDVGGNDAPIVVVGDVYKRQVGYVPFVIGKHTGLADHILDKPTVSRFHVRIMEKGPIEWAAFVSEIGS